MLVDLGAVPVGQTVGSVLAQDPAPPPGKGEEFGKASPVGLVVLVLLFVALVLLIRSMNKHLRKVPASFEPDAGASSDAAPSDVAPSTTGSRKDDDTADGPARG